MNNYGWAYERPVKPPCSATFPTISLASFFDMASSASQPQDSWLYETRRRTPTDTLRNSPYTSSASATLDLLPPASAAAPMTNRPLHLKGTYSVRGPASPPPTTTLSHLHRLYQPPLRLLRHEHKNSSLPRPPPTPSSMYFIGILQREGPSYRGP